MTYPRELIVIPCSNTKEPGGSVVKWEAGASVVGGLTETGANELLAARRTLSQLPCRRDGEVLGTYDVGTDLGGGVEANEPLRPALNRYRGLIYGKAQRHLGRMFASTEGVELIIVSGLYGLLESREAIRNYTLTMRDRTPDGRFIRDWWKGRRLGQLLLEYATRKNFDPSLVHNFLGGDYADACIEFSDWKPPKRYPGLRTASLYRRHDDIMEVLSRHRIRLR